VETGIIIAILAAIALLNALFFWLQLRAGSRNAPKESDGNTQAMLMLNRQVSDLGRIVDAKLGESSKLMHDSVGLQFSESQKLIQSINTQMSGQLISLAREMAEAKETTKQVLSIAGELASLQDILKNPKQRGILGEYYLETLLKNILPPSSYQMQYAFSDGTIVDAVVFVKDKIIPIDSKFSLENYQRLSAEKEPAERERLEKLFRQDLKNRIDETGKYVKPAEGTLDFAFMFIPHEAIYYDLLVSQVGAVTINTRDLVEYAFKEKRVVIVSPTSFHAYLQTVLQGLKALQIEESAQQIIRRVGELARHLKSYEDYHAKLGTALGTVVSHWNTSSKEFKKIEKDVVRIAGDEVALGYEPILLEKPVKEEE
jgi:DNA recombination protein RmuC